MKKILFATMLVLGTGTSMAIANDVKSDSVEINVQLNDFQPIEVDSLPEAVKEAIAKNYSEATIKSASAEVAEDGTATYQIVLVTADETECTIKMNEKGEPVE